MFGGFGSKNRTITPPRQQTLFDLLFLSFSAVYVCDQCRASFGEYFHVAYPHHGNWFVYGAIQHGMVRKNQLPALHRKLFMTHFNFFKFILII